MIDPTLFQTMNDYLPESTKELLFNPTAEAVGQGIGSIFTLVFSPLLKRGILKKQELADLTNKTATKVKSIPTEFKDGSKLALVLKALEESKYQIQDEDLRNLFASLIASTVDSRKNEGLTPRYATVLSQLGSKDAQFLLLLSKQMSFQLPIGHLIASNIHTYAERELSNDCFCTNSNSVALLPMDTTNILDSLGIIKLHNDGMAILTYDLYQKQYPLIESHLKAITLNPTLFTDEEIKLRKGSIITTNFGRNLFQCIF